MPTLAAQEPASIEGISSLLPTSVVINALVQLLGPLALTLGIFTLYKLVNFIWREYISNPLADLPGPPTPSWLYGNMRQIWDADNSVMHESWVSEYGNTMKYKAFLGVSVLLVSLHSY